MAIKAKSTFFHTCIPEGENPQGSVIFVCYSHGSTVFDKITHVANGSVHTFKVLYKSGTSSDVTEQRRGITVTLSNVSQIIVDTFHDGVQVQTESHTVPSTPPNKVAIINVTQL